MSGWLQHNGFDKIDINYLKDKIAHNMAYKTIQAKSFDRLKYKRMIVRIVTLNMEGYNYSDIAKRIGRSSERVRQLLHRFYKRVRWVIEHDNQPTWLKANKATLNSTKESEGK